MSLTPVHFTATDWQTIKPIKCPFWDDFPTLTRLCSVVEKEVHVLNAADVDVMTGLVDRFVEQLSTEESALELLPQQAALPLRTLHEATVLLRSARQVRDDLVHRAVRHILVHRESHLTCSQKHKHVNAIRIKTSAPSHAALLSTHPTGSWSDRTFPAAGQSKPYSQWERDSSRSFCAEEHTLAIIDLWSRWMYFTRLDSLFQREFDRVLVVRRHHDVCHPVVVDLLQNVLQTPYRQRSGLTKASRNPSMTETDE